MPPRSPASRFIRFLAPDKRINQPIGLDGALLPVLPGFQEEADMQTRTEIALPQEPLTVTVPHALKVSGFGRTMLYQLVKDGTLKSTTIGKRRLINYASLKQLLTGDGR